MAPFSYSWSRGMFAWRHLIPNKIIPNNILCIFKTGIQNGSLLYITQYNSFTYNVYKFLKSDKCIVRVDVFKSKFCYDFFYLYVLRVVSLNLFKHANKYKPMAAFHHVLAIIQFTLLRLCPSSFPS